MVRREQFVNDASATMNGTVNSTTTSFVVDDASVFPTSGDFRLLVDSEVVLVTDVTANTLTVERAADGTTAATHADTTSIEAVLTAGAIDQYMDDATAGYSDRYPFRILDESGNTLTSSNFTWVNQGTATVSDDAWGGITMTTNTLAGDNMRILKRSAPSGAWTLTAHFLFGPGYNNGGGASSSYMSLLVRESDTGKLGVIEIRIGGLVRVRRYSSPTSFNSEQATLDFSSDRAWLQIEDDTTNLIFRISADGINWLDVASYARATYMTSAGPDEIGFLANSDSGTNLQPYHIQAWVVE